MTAIPAQVVSLATLDDDIRALLVDSSTDTAAAVRGILGSVVRTIHLMDGQGGFTTATPNTSGVVEIPAGGGAPSGDVAPKSSVAFIRKRTPSNEAHPTSLNWEARPDGYGLVIAIGANPPPNDAAPTDIHMYPSVNTTTIPGYGLYYGQYYGGGDPATTRSPLWSDSFTGADGAAWLAGLWVPSRTPAGGGSTIQGNAGQLKTGTTGGWALADKVTVRYVQAPRDLEILFNLTFPPAGEVHPGWFFRATDPAFAGTNGYLLSVDLDNLALTSYVGGTPTGLGSTPITLDRGTAYRVRLLAKGSALKARIWQAATAEPSTWSVEVNSTAWLEPGYMGFHVSGGGQPQSSTVSVDTVESYEPL